jgi:chitodextrinase
VHQQGRLNHEQQQKEPPVPRRLARGIALSATLILALALDWSAGAKRAQAAPTDGMVAAYAFGEGSGATTADTSGSNNTGILSGASWTAAGQTGNALSFNGSSAFVNLGNGPALQFTGSMTVSAWVKASAFPVDDAAVVSKRTGSNVGFQLDTTVDSGPRTIGFKLASATGALMARYGATVLQLNQWYYVTGVYDAAARTLNVYLNGALDNGTLRGTVTTTQQDSTLNVNIARRPGLAGFAFNGTIDEVRIYNRALSPAEIQLDMQLAVTTNPLPPPPDTSAPSAPGALTAAAAASTQINLAWSAATDNVGVAGYRLERCAGSGCTTFTQIASPAGTSFNDNSLSAGTSYSYRVRAADAAGNLGAYSNAASATTAPAAVDLTPPGAPGSLSAAVAGSTQINLAWGTSTDNVGVTGYRVERCAGGGCTAFAQIAAPTGTSFSDTGLSASTSYSYRVRASDAAGNLGAYSNAATATTASIPSGSLVAAYAFSEGSGATTADASGNNNTGILNGTSWTAAGQAGNALSFNGSSAFVNLGNGAALQLTGSMTVSAWIKASAFPVDDAAVVSKRTLNGNIGFQLDTSVDSGPRTIGFKLTSATGALMARYGASALQLNQWYYVTGVYDAAARTLNVYLNGAQDNGALRGTVSATQQNSPLNVNVGRRSGGPGFEFNGTIDEVRIYNRALSAAEIQVDMQSAVPMPIPSPSDTSAPSAPGVLSAAAASSTQINLAWSAATDNVGVTGYRVERCAGSGCTAFTQIATPTGTSFSDTSLTAATSYSYRVRAADAAGNLGAYSTPASATTASAPTPPAGAARGPLRVLPTNPRWFTDGTGNAVFLGGSHTWNNLQDWGADASPRAFDFASYVSTLKAHGHNFTILWRTELPKFCGLPTTASNPPDFTVAQHPWQRTGPGLASDGRPKFDLTKFDQAFFDRLRARAVQLNDAGIYAGIYFFTGEWLNIFRCAGDGHPLTGTNNVNSIEDGGGIGSMMMSAPNAITGVQDALVEKMIDTLNDLPNILWLVSEEGPPNATWWNDHLIAHVRAYEAGKPLQHPIGYGWPLGSPESTVINSDADWVAIVSKVFLDTPCGNGTPACKVIMNDSDHSYFGMWNESAQANRNYAWQNFLSGNSVSFMDPYTVLYPREGRNLCLNPVNAICDAPDQRWKNFRDNLGYLVKYANRMNLAQMTPQPSLSSTRWALAHAASSQAEYLVYQSGSGGFTVNLSATTQTLNVEWLNPATGAATPGTPVRGGSSAQPFTPPFAGDAVLYLVDSAGNGRP